MVMTSSPFVRPSHILACSFWRFCCGRMRKNQKTAKMTISGTTWTRNPSIPPAAAASPAAMASLTKSMCTPKEKAKILNGLLQKIQPPQWGKSADYKEHGPEHCLTPAPNKSLILSVSGTERDFLIQCPGHDPRGRFSSTLQSVPLRAQRASQRRA